MSTTPCWSGLDNELSSLDDKNAYSAPREQIAERRQELADTIDDNEMDLHVSQFNKMQTKIPGGFALGIRFNSHLIQGLRNQPLTFPDDC